MSSLVQGSEQLENLKYHLLDYGPIAAPVMSRLEIELAKLYRKPLNDDDRSKLRSETRRAVEESLDRHDRCNSVIDAFFATECCIDLDEIDGMDDDSQMSVSTAASDHGSLSFGISFEAQKTLFKKMAQAMEQVKEKYDLEQGHMVVSGKTGDLYVKSRARQTSPDAMVQDGPTCHQGDVAMLESDGLSASAAREDAEIFIEDLEECHTVWQEIADQHERWEREWVHSRQAVQAGNPRSSDAVQDPEANESPSLATHVRRSLGESRARIEGHLQYLDSLFTSATSVEGETGNDGHWSTKRSYPGDGDMSRQGSGGQRTSARIDGGGRKRALRSYLQRIPPQARD